MIWISIDIDICRYNRTKLIILSHMSMNIVSQRFNTKFRTTEAGQFGRTIDC